MGLGLSICQSIVKAHGGSLGYEPNLGSGAVFRFTLESVPRSVDDDDDVTETDNPHRG
jgi:signal transduction histidine kinase